MIYSSWTEFCMKCFFSTLYTGSCEFNVLIIFIFLLFLRVYQTLIVLPLFLSTFFHWALNFEYLRMYVAYFEVRCTFISSGHWGWCKCGPEIFFSGLPILQIVFLTDILSLICLSWYFFGLSSFAISVWSEERSVKTAG